MSKKSMNVIDNFKRKKDRRITINMVIIMEEEIHTTTKIKEIINLNKNSMSKKILRTPKIDAMMMVKKEGSNMLKKATKMITKTERETMIISLNKKSLKLLRKKWMKSLRKHLNPTFLIMRSLRKNLRRKKRVKINNQKREKNLIYQFSQNFKV